MWTVYHWGQKVSKSKFRRKRIEYLDQAKDNNLERSNKIKVMWDLGSMKRELGLYVRYPGRERCQEHYENENLSKELITLQAKIG